MRRSFENLIASQKQEESITQKPTETVAVHDTTVQESVPVKKDVDDFGLPVIPKASSPFETKQTANKVLNPHQKSLQGYLKEQQRDKVLRKALTLYRAFKQHCIQNKIDPNIFLGEKK